MNTPEMVSEARFYDFYTMVDFSGELRVVAYAVQTDGFDGEMSASDIWSATVQAVGEVKNESPPVVIGRKAAEVGRLTA